MPHPKQCAGDSRLSVGPVQGGHDLEQGVEAVRAPLGRQGPGIYQLEIRCNLGDDPGMRRVLGLREPHPLPPYGGIWTPRGARTHHGSCRRGSFPGARTRSTRVIRSPATVSDTTVVRPSLSKRPRPRAPLTLMTWTCSPGRIFAVRPSRKRATRSAPRTGRRAAETWPPPSLVRTTSGSSAVSRALRFPPAAARRNAVTVASCSAEPTLTRGARALTCARARAP